MAKSSKSKTHSGLDPSKLSISVNFESHPPIESDHEGVSALIKQLNLDGVNIGLLATHIISLNDITQVLVMPGDDDDDDGGGDDEDNEPDNGIYGVASVIDLNLSDDNQAVAQVQKYLTSNCSHVNEIITTKGKQYKTCLLLNERMVNLPPQISLPTLAAMQSTLQEYDYIILVAKTLVKEHKNRGTKRRHTEDDQDDDDDEDRVEQDELVFVNSEEEIFSENCVHQTDVRLASDSDDSSTGVMHHHQVKSRRIITIDRSESWSKIMAELEKELK